MIDWLLAAFPILLVLVLMILLIIRRFKKRSRVHDAPEVTRQKKRKET